MAEKQQVTGQIWNCPECGTPGRQIIYGYVHDVGDIEKLRQQSPTGLIELGGCVQTILISEQGRSCSSPDYKCDACDHRWCVQGDAIDE
ncbi:hypothetical protein RJ527_14275 [Thalassospiraceae bacterium LMO-SO8]|nr:hypothetical protein [Alphaproteobacteria bacterium LMO-S08]WND75191.1 hypothetical protein RJ527_14275 [Thalassospiraceae bacterium LMO-SO8]